MHDGRRHIRRCMKFSQIRIHKTASLLICGILALLLSVGMGILVGAAELSLSEVFSALWDHDRTTAAGRILWYVRIPRVCTAAVCGAALAVSGAVIQGVLSNHLASPGMIGINAGAALAVTVCAACGILGGWQLSLFAFLGAFGTSIVVSTAAKHLGASDGVVILLGAALNSLLGACTDTVTSLYPDVSIMNSQFRAGDFSAATTAKLLPAAAIVLPTLCLLFLLSNALDVLTLGEDHARSLGMHTGKTRLLFLMLSALLAGTAVSAAGLLSFVGLLVPHAVRRLAGGDAAHLLPFCALFGGAFTVLCDTAARTLFAPYELPVGILLAFLGAPFFLFLLFRRRKTGGTV